MSRASKSNRKLRLGLAIACLLGLVGLSLIARSWPLVPTYADVEFRGRQNVSLETIEQATGLKRGVPADPALVRVAVRKIEGLYRNQGFIMSQVGVLEGGSPGDTRVVIAIEEGPWFNGSEMAFPTPIMHGPVPRPGDSGKEKPAPSDARVEQADFAMPKIRSADDWATSHRDRPNPIATPKVGTGDGESADPFALPSSLQRYKAMTAGILADPTNAENYRARSVLFALSGQVLRAIADRNEAIRLDPGRATDHLERGLCHGRSGQLDRALADMERGLSLANDDSTRSDAHRCRAEILVQRRAFAAAIADLGRAIELKPGQARDRLQRGFCHIAIGKFDEAIEDLERAIEAEPSASALSYLAFCYSSTGEPRKAEACCDRAISLEPDAPDYVNYRAFLRGCRGHGDEALADLGKAIQANAEDATALNFRAWIHLSRRDLAKAAADFDRVLELAPCRADYAMNFWISDASNLEDTCCDHAIAIFEDRSRHRPDLYGVLSILTGDEAKTQNLPNPYFRVNFVGRPMANRWMLNAQFATYYSCVPEAKSAAFGRAILAMLQADGDGAWYHGSRALLLLGEWEAPGSSRPTAFQLFNMMRSGFAAFQPRK